MASNFFGGAFFGGGFFGSEAATEAPKNRGGLTRKQRRQHGPLAVSINGKYQLFRDWDAVYAFLDSLTEREEKKAEAKAVQAIKRTGKAKKPPVVTVQQAPEEVRDYISDLNAKIERTFWRKVAEELAAREEDDLEAILLSL